MSFRPLLIATMLVLVVSSSAKAVLVTLIDPGSGDNKGTTGPNGVFNLTFHHGISYDALQSKLGTVSPITWTSFDDVLIVATAIKGAVNAFGDVTGTRTDDVVIPYEEILTDPPKFRAALALNDSTTNYSLWYALPPMTPQMQLQSWVLSGSDDAWVTAVSVPEPGAFLCVGLAGLGIVTWKKVKSRLRHSS